MKKLVLITTILLALFTAEAKDRKVAVQMYSLNNLTFVETVDALKSIGVKHLEAFPGQRFSKEEPFSVNIGMSKEQIEKVKEFIKKSDVEVVSFGVSNYEKEDQIRALYELVRDLEFPVAVIEAKPMYLPIYEKYSEEMGIISTLHNHTVNTEERNTTWGDFKNVAREVNKYKFIFAEPDNGHWTRSGLDNKEGFKLLAGKIYAIHLKDLMSKGTIENPGPNDCVVFGKGNCDIKGILKLLDEQGFDGYFIIEHEGESDDKLKDIKECIEFLKSN